MNNKIVPVLLWLVAFTQITSAQFGQNKVQYKDFTWYYIQTKHFDVYFNQDGGKLAEFTALASESALASIHEKLNYQINNRISIILYNSQNDFQETNVTDEYLSEGIGGFTELFKNRVVLPFTGDYYMFRHVIHHELVHAVMNDMFYGGSIQNVISNNITVQLPLWFSEGLAEYLSLGWDTNTDMFLRDAATSEYLPDINGLNGYFAYRGGQSVFFYIAEKYGEEKVGELVNKIKSKGNLEEGLEASIGLKLEELNERWRKYLKKKFYPDISEYVDPDEFSKRLTDHRKDGGFYNTSPAISPNGDKVAFISNRDYFFDVYIMSAQDGKIIKRLVKGNRTADFEELNILTPGLTWSPKGDKIALSAKSNGYDVIYIIDVEEEDIETLPLKFAGIGTVHWSPDGSRLTFAGHSPTMSDIYVYEFESKKLINVTDDIYSDADPAWTPDGKKIVFASDRQDDLILSKNYFEYFKLNNFQKDLYLKDLESGKTIKITNTPTADESSPVFSSDGNQLLCISDLNGINNIYLIDVSEIQTKLIAQSDTLLKMKPVTNSLNGVYQLSLSNDSKKLTFSSMYQAAYNIFLMNNPFEPKTKLLQLKPTLYIQESSEKPETHSPEVVQNENGEKKDSISFFTGQFLDTTSTQGQKTDFSNYVFGESDYYTIDTSKSAAEFNLTDNIDSSGNYRVNKYKITFSPDIIYANAGFSTLYGLLGTTVISFSDVLGNHRLIGQTSLQIDLKNSDYGLAYFYLPERMDLGIQGFHTARFVYLDRNGAINLFRFRNYGAIASASYAINRFYRIEGGISFLNASAENLDFPDDEFEKVTFLLPALAFVHDNTIFGYTAPIEGTRYRFDIYANPLLQSKRYGFYSFLADARTYLRFWGDYSFAMRYSGGYSRGNNPQRFFIGGIENWINRRFATSEVPLSSPSDFAFLTAALPLRGFDYATQIGNTYSLVNMELRFPLIRYLLTGALPILFRDVLGVAFIDAGAAWNKNSELKLFRNDPLKGTVTDDLLIGTGVGARLYFLYFLTRFDVAWSYDLNSFSRPIFYFSIGADF